MYQCYRVLYLRLWILVSWKSIGQKHVTLSSTEAKYVAVSEVCQETMFIKSILEFIRVRVKTPITVYCDNVGTIFLAYNTKTGGRTKHIDVKYHYVWEFVRDGVIQIIFVRSENNNSDVFTKNTAQKTYEMQSENFMETIGWSCGRVLEDTLTRATLSMNEMTKRRM